MINVVWQAVIAFYEQSLTSADAAVASNVTKSFHALLKLGRGITEGLSSGSFPNARLVRTVSWRAKLLTVCLMCLQYPRSNPSPSSPSCLAPRSKVALASTLSLTRRSEFAFTLENEASFSGGRMINDSCGIGKTLGLSAPSLTSDVVSSVLQECDSRLSWYSVVAFDRSTLRSCQHSPPVNTSCC